jgi:hypothetical protein
MDRVLLLTPDGCLTEQEYEITRPPDRKRLVGVRPISGGPDISVHELRMFPVNSKGKAIAIKHNGKFKAVCPHCKKIREVSSDILECNCVVPFTPVLLSEALPEPSQKKLVTKEKTLETETEITTEEAAAGKETAAQPITLADLAAIKVYGELWEKPRVQFNHATMVVKAYTLLADEPARKMCFNTYDGSLGKKAKGLETLCLDQFKDGTKCTLLKKGLEAERTRLTKSGYTLLS